jgi:hypothetical protein
VGALQRVLELVDGLAVIGQPGHRAAGLDDLLARIASRTPSLTPRPLSPIPPNGVSSVRQPGTSLTLTVPARSSRTQRAIARQSNAHTALESAYGVEVGGRDRGIEVAHADDRRDRPEGLVRDQLGIDEDAIGGPPARPAHRRARRRAGAARPPPPQPRSDRRSAPRPARRSPFPRRCARRVGPLRAGPPRPPRPAPRARPSASTISGAVGRGLPQADHRGRRDRGPCAKR